MDTTNFYKYIRECTYVAVTQTQIIYKLVSDSFTQILPNLVSMVSRTCTKAKFDDLISDAFCAAQDVYYMVKDFLDEAIDKCIITPALVTRMDRCKNSSKPRIVAVFSDTSMDIEPLFNHFWESTDNHGCSNFVNFAEEFSNIAEYYFDNIIEIHYVIKDQIYALKIDLQAEMDLTNNTKLDFGEIVLKAANKQE